MNEDSSNGRKATEAARVGSAIGELAAANERKFRALNKALDRSVLDFADGNFNIEGNQAERMLRAEIGSYLRKATERMDKGQTSPAIALGKVLAKLDLADFAPHDARDESSADEALRRRVCSDLARQLRASEVLAPLIANVDPQNPDPGAGDEQQVYHGSPYAFDRFDASHNRLGGEGANGFGYGHYLSEDSAEANAYRVGLSYDPEEMRVEGRKINDLYDDITDRAARMSVQQAAVEYEKLEILERLMMNEMMDEVIDYAKALSKEAQRWLEQRVMPSFKTYGHLYRVSIPADRELLDWDATLAEQPAHVRSLLDAAGVAERIGTPEDGAPVTGHFIYQSLADAFESGCSWTTDWLSARNISLRSDDDFHRGREAASRYLESIGIPGLTYISDGSRGEAGGIRNYVIWDESRMRVIGRDVGLTTASGDASCSDPEPEP